MCSSDLVTDNPNLDNGYAVFGRVLGAGMTVVDAMAAVPTYNPFNRGGVFAELPLRNATAPLTAVQPNQFVTMTSISRASELVYTATSSNTTLVAASILNGGLKLDYGVGRSGTATITVRATSVFNPNDYQERQFTLTRSAFDPPGAPTALGGTPANGQVSLTWTPASNGGTPITNYLVEYSGNNGANWTTVTRAASALASATVAGLTNGTAYLFRVSAVNAVGTGPAVTTTSTVTPRTLPGAPTAASGSQIGRAHV